MNLFCQFWLPVHNFWHFWQFFWHFLAFFGNFGNFFGNMAFLAIFGIFGNFWHFLAIFGIFDTFSMTTLFSFPCRSPWNTKVFIGFIMVLLGSREQRVSYFMQSMNLYIRTRCRTRDKVLRERGPARVFRYRLMASGWGATYWLWKRCWQEDFQEFRRTNFSGRFAP